MGCLVIFSQKFRRKNIRFCNFWRGATLFCHQNWIWNINLLTFQLLSTVILSLSKVDQKLWPKIQTPIFCGTTVFCGTFTCIRRLVFLYKIVNGLAPSYLSEYLPSQHTARPNLRASPAIRHLTSRTERYRNSFFPFSISQWNNLDSHIRDRPSISSFKRAIFDFFRPKPASPFKTCNYYGLTLITRLRVGFSHLREHKFRHGFTIDPICDCRTNCIETTEHFLLQCSNYSNLRLVLFNSLQNLDISIIPLNPPRLSKILLYGDSDLPLNTNHTILGFVIKFLCDSNRFNGSIFWFLSTIWLFRSGTYSTFLFIFAYYFRVFFLLAISLSALREGVLSTFFSISDVTF